jgi:methionine synthase II (cobalamin-independent)
MQEARCKGQEARDKFEPRCLATTIGSLPHTDVALGARLMIESTPEIPSWAQFPKRTFYENMMVQFTEGLPGLVEDVEGERVYFDTAAPDFVEQLTDFYSRYLAATEAGDSSALDSFGLSSKYAAGFAEFLARLPEQKATPVMLKGQVTGPFTLGTNLLDQDRRCSYYDDQLRDVIVKTVALKATWQMTRLSAFGPRAMIFLDEPALLGFGSQTFLTISREDVIGDINEVVAAIHAQGGLSGVHCEENTDWSLLMETDLDILDFDAYDHVQGITLYPVELRAFLERGGSLGWGIIPTLDREAAATETLPSLLERFDEGVERLARKGFERELLLRRALITPSCGAGGVLTEPLAERVLILLRQMSTHLRDQYGFAGSEV